MPDTRTHRGPHPDDETLFAHAKMPALRAAAADLSWLRSRGYGEAATRLVGDRYELTQRQRDAVARSACSDEAYALRRASACRPADCAGEVVRVDGFNVLITLESALGGAYVFVGRDGCYRDVGGLRGTYRLVQETQPAIRLAGEALAALGVRATQWVLDERVSNCRRLRSALLAAADASGWTWTVEITGETDAALTDTPHVVATSDSRVLDRVARWVNLTAGALRLGEGDEAIRRLL